MNDVTRCRASSPASPGFGRAPRAPDATAPCRPAILSITSPSLRRSPGRGPGCPASAGPPAARLPFASSAGHPVGRAVRRSAAGGPRDPHPRALQCPSVRSRTSPRMRAWKARIRAALRAQGEGPGRRGGPDGLAAGRQKRKSPEGVDPGGSSMFWWRFRDSNPGPADYDSPPASQRRDDTRSNTAEQATERADGQSACDR